MALGNRHSAGTVWLPTGNPDTTNISGTDFTGMGGQPGSLGIAFEASNPGRSYQRVQLDSGASAASPSGVVAANQLAYWKDKAQYLVTNDAAQAIGGSGVGTSAFRNEIAGIFRSAVTAGYYCDVLQRGRAVSVKTTGSPTTGDNLVGDTSATAAQAATVASGTAPTVQSIGVVNGTTTANVTPCDVDIPFVQ